MIHKNAHSIPFNNEYNLFKLVLGFVILILIHKDSTISYEFNFVVFLYQ